MSSDLIQENIPDRKGISILLTYYTGGAADLTLMLPDRDENDNPIEVTPSDAITYNLTPDDTGWEHAKIIADALNYWIEHTKSLQQEHP